MSAEEPCVFSAFYQGPVLGLVRIPKESFSVLGGLPGHPLRRLDNAPMLYRADPFYLRVDEQRWLFFEEYLYLRNRGRLAALPLNADLQPCGPARVALELPLHLSFPFVVAAEGEIWMLPECEKSGRVDLYRCLALPDRWQHVATLLNGVEAADSTLHRQNGRWWLFTSLRQPGGRSMALFSSPDLLGGVWTPHPANAEKRGSGLPNGSGRPAGRPFLLGERWVRPVQWNPDYYGQGLRFFELTELSENSWEERLTEVPGLPWRRHHHICYTPGEACWVDQRTRVPGGARPLG